MLIDVQTAEIDLIEEEIEKTQKLISEAAEILGDELQEALSCLQPRKTAMKKSALARWAPASCIADFVGKLSGIETSSATSLGFLLTTDRLRQGYTDEDD